MFRVYDHAVKKWIKDEVFLSQNDFYRYKGKVFKRLESLNAYRYSLDIDIGITDKYKRPIFENDYLKLNVEGDKEVLGVVKYIPEYCSYVALCDETNEYYTIGSDYANHIMIVGNIYDGICDMYPEIKERLESLQNRLNQNDGEDHDEVDE